MVKPGITVLLERCSEHLAGKRLGLVTNASAILPDLSSSVDALRRLDDARLVALFAPEHGIDVTAGEGVHVISSVDRATSLPIHSLYGEARRPSASMLEGLDVLVFDIQSVLPFQIAGAPYLNGRALADSMNRLGLPGVGFRPVQFEPLCGKWAGERCSGVQLHILDRDRLRPVTAVLHLLAAVNALHPEAITFYSSHFDRLVGTDSVRHALNSGVPVDEIVGDWVPAQTTFTRQRAEVLMYE